LTLTTKRYSKLVLIGIDCLDPYLVSHWRLKRYYSVGPTGFHFVGFDLYTPIIWAKMITGLPVEKYGYSSRQLSRKKRLLSLYYLGYLVSKMTSPHKQKKTNTSPGREGAIKTAVRKAIRGDDLSLLEKVAIGLLSKAASVEKLPRKLRRKTIIHYAASKGLRPWAIEFPPFNDHIYSVLRNMLYFYIDSAPSEKKLFLEYIWELTTRTLNLLIQCIDRYDVILWYTPYIDTASHMYYRPWNIRDMTKLAAIYRRLGNLIREKLLSMLNDDWFIVIASDHGFNPSRQDHSHYGYWSMSTTDYGKPSNVTEIAEVLKKVINLIARR